tara:strand:+ start:791 stop:1102 length:312 start_codon:yes stop_codon:yes gene_type:complete
MAQRYIIENSWRFYNKISKYRDGVLEFPKGFEDLSDFLDDLSPEHHVFHLNDSTAVSHADSGMEIMDIAGKPENREKARKTLEQMTGVKISEYEKTPVAYDKT